ncbi:MAG: hypothetical protein ACP5RD_01460 [bacterium]|jgi:metal-responsive CopG/Arc/MetJ family transcriptional regulator
MKKEYFKINDNIIEIEFELNEDNQINIKKIENLSKIDAQNINNIEIISFKDNNNYTEIIFKIQDQIKRAFILDNNIYILEDNLINATIIDSSSIRSKSKNITLEDNLNQLSIQSNVNIKNNVKKEDNKYYLVPPLSGKIEKINAKEGDIINPNYINLYKTEVVNNEIKCIIIEGDTPEIKAQKLISKLKELKVI